MTHMKRVLRPSCSWLSALALSLFLLPPIVLAQQFQVAPQYPALGFSYAVAVGDFRGIGKADLAAVNLSNNAVSVLLGNGDGTFQPPAEYPVASNPYAVVVGDFNGDGKLDLAVSAFSASASQCQSVVSILLGNGDGTFQPHMDFATGGLTPVGMAAGDLRGNGKLDLVIANGQVPSNAVSVLLGNGDGTFQPPVNYSTGGSPLAVAVGDFNGDGKADLAVLSHDLGPTNVVVVSILIGNGNGTFKPHVDYATGNGATGLVPNEIVVADFRGIGKLDIAASTYQGVSILLGNGDGTFQQHVEYSTGGDLCGVAFTCEGGLAVGDFNGDGKPDLAAANGHQMVNVLLSNGDGTFQAPAAYVATYGTFGPFSIAVGDFNGDHKPDLAAAKGPGALSILLNNGSGGFEAARSYTTGDAPNGVASADLNGDGKLDLAVANFVGNTVSVLLGKGDGTFVPKVDYPTASGPVSIAVGDFNRDGKLDLAVAASSVSILLGNGDGTFQPHVDYAAGAGVASIAAGDFNGDGNLDLAVANCGSNTVSILLGKGDGTFQPHVDYGTGLCPLSVAVGDFNGDGKPDLAVAFNGDSSNQSTNPGGVDILINRGDGSFLPAVAYSSGGVASAVAAGDFNGDGKLDLAVANGGQTCHPHFGNPFCSPGSGLGVLLGNGDGTFRTSVTYATDAGPHSVVAVDFDGDGKMDLAVANLDSNTVSILLGNGDGTFRSTISYQVGYNPVSVAAGDFNGDLKPDFAGTALGNNSVTVLLNTTTGPVYVLSATASVFSGGPLGGVFSQPAGILCGAIGTLSGAEAQCSAAYNAGTSVTLLPEVPPGSSLTGWSGDCTGTGPCVLDMNLDHFVTANFGGNTTTFMVTVLKSGNGTGTVADAPNVGQINCGTTCSTNYPAGSIDVLGAAAAPGSVFAGWSGGGCTSSMIDCTLTINSNLTVTATFDVPDFSLTPASTALTLQPAAQATDVITLAGKPFAGAIQLTCSVTGPSPMPGCSLSPPSVTPGVGSVTSTLTIIAPSTAAQLPAGRPQLGRFLYAMWLPLMMGLAIVGRSKGQRYGARMLRALFAVLLIWQMGCGSSSTSNGPPPPTNYTVTVTGTSGSIQHSTQVSVTVQ